MTSLSEINRHLATRIRVARQCAGMSQSELGQMLDLSSHQFQRYEAAVNSIGAGMLFVIAHILDVELAYFFEGLDPGHFPGGWVQ